MKIIFVAFSFLFVIAFQQLHAQDIEVRWGAPNKVSRGSLPSDVLGKDESGFYILKGVGVNTSLEKFDLNMNWLWTKELDVYLTKKDKTIFENIIISKTKIIVFSSLYDGKTDTKRLFASYISKEGLLDPKLYEVNSFDNLASKKSVTYDVTLSEDEKSILIFSNFKEKNNEKEKFHYKIIDENFLEKGMSFIELPYKGSNTTIIDYIIDNASNIHLVYSVDLKREELNNKSNDDKIDFNYYILSYYTATKEYKEYDLRVGDNKITGLSIIIDKESRFMYVPGFYSEKKLNALAGTIISKIDLLNKKVVYAKQKEFDAAFLAVVYNKPLDEEVSDPNKPEKKKPKATDQLYNYDIVDLFVNDKEEVVVISEKYWVNVVTTTTTNANGGTTTRTTYYYYYNNVMVTKFNSSGERAWCSNIPKFQVSTDDYGFYSSIGVFEHKDIVYIFYNDNPVNGTEFSPKQYRTKNPQKSQVALISIDGDGNLKKRVLMPAPDKGKGIATRPKFSAQVDDNQVLLLGYLSSEYKIGKLELK
ncbi:hypothetical protein [uncultured Cytophaga sp.]|uniref:hypothetical protein n=1 Tax=uncultured Cytophaga sp. TaxID=160238 RepID=UPI002630E62D|nr:hypothetical protein [uncultured Cytophaga sp.]